MLEDPRHRAFFWPWPLLRYCRELPVVPDRLEQPGDCEVAATNIRKTICPSHRLAPRIRISVFLYLVDDRDIGPFVRDREEPASRDHHESTLLIIAASHSPCEAIQAGPKQNPGSSAT